MLASVVAATAWAAPGPDLLYFSTLNNTTIPGVPGPYDDADIYRYGAATGAFDRVFDARNAGLPSAADIDALHVIDPITFLMSFAANAGTVVPGLGTVMDEDIVLYHAGKFEWYLRGALVGLGDDGDAEDIGAIHALSDGSLLVSTVGAPTLAEVPGAKPHDVLRCDGVFGPYASCAWSLYFDGSRDGLSTSGEKLDALFEADSDLHFSTRAAFSVPGLAGDGPDVLRCHRAEGGGIPVRCAAYSAFFDGSTAGLADNLDAAHFAPNALANPDPAAFRVVVLGTSTAAGTGASSPAASWAGLLDAWLGTVTVSHELINLAEGGLTTEPFRPDGVSPLPDPNLNITRALELSPDLVILNFPSNNVAAGIPIETTIAHYTEIKAAADERGVAFLLTTTQPRNFSTLARRTQLRDEAIAVRAVFGELVIDVYDELANMTNLRLKPNYDSGDGTHLNDAGHLYLFETARDKVSAYVTP